VAVFTKEHTFNKETTHTIHDITQCSTNSTMDIKNYKNSNTSTMNINSTMNISKHEKRKKQTNSNTRAGN
jgi:hypothetical protein